MAQGVQQHPQSQTENCCTNGKVISTCPECAGSPRKSQTCQYCLGAGTTWYPCPRCTAYTSTGAVSFDSDNNHDATSENIYDSRGGGNSGSEEWHGQHGYGSASGK